MPVVTKIVEQKRSPNRRSIYLDGTFAFGCNLNVVARFRLCDGLQLSADQILEIQNGELRQECMDSALRSLQTRLHGRAELRKKLMKKEWGDAVVDGVLDDLQRMGYIDDERFAKSRAISAAQHKQHGRRRALMELLSKGIKGDVADKALDEIYSESDSLAVARKLVEKQQARLLKMEPAVARRRVVGMLQRRGFDYDLIKPIVDELLGRDRAD